MKYDFDKSIGKLSAQISKKLGLNLEQKFNENGIALKSPDWSVLAMLYKHGKKNQRDIAAFLKLDKVRIKRTVDRLEKENLVSREESKGDKRFNYINLTPKGKKTYNKLVPYAEEVISQAIKNIPEKDYEHCIQVLERIDGNLEEVGEDN